MKNIVQTTFRSTVEFLPSEIDVMPLELWNESVLRYYFCRFLATTHSEVQQFVECGKIDLVLWKPPQRAFIEFKLYRHPLRLDPYDGKARGFKGGPGPKNLKEFQACVDQLHDRPFTPDLSKYVVLVYADPADESRPNLRYSFSFDKYRHPRDNVALCLVESSGPLETKDGVLRAQLYEVGNGSSAAPTAALDRGGYPDFARHDGAADSPGR